MRSGQSCISPSIIPSNLFDLLRFLTCHAPALRGKRIRDSLDVNDHVSAAMTATSATPFDSEETRDLMRVWFRLLRLDASIGVAVTQRLRVIGLSIAQFDLLS